ncbi:MAG: toll/interleukin-1 receptor domain-containing protein [Bacteroidales bacterium]|nr:toll/interleukin-1 receptor domain-containing protein [Bacteroidales bacterium]
MDSALEKETLYDVFVSYSYLEKASAVLITELLEKCGYKVYIDLRDDDINKHQEVNKKTAERIIQNMKVCKSLLFLHTNATKNSQWCPWELGYFNGFRNRCAIIPLTEKNNETVEHQEFLSLYPYVDYEKITTTEEYDFWVNDRDQKNKYSTLKKWIETGSLKSHNQ